MASSSKPGARGTHSIQQLMPIRRSLVAAVLGDDLGKPPERRPARDFSGPKPRVYRAGKHPDAVVLEMRRLKEQCQMMPTPIVAHMAALGVTCTREEVMKILSYQTRGHLVPDEGAKPYIKEANDPAT